ncbi:MAG TPA: hypothetical protein VHZ04_01220 [Candidatus Paceibacterota bacterium]|jgi:2-phosphoglycerate kinase|nr:hypothetical protein [Candidatus Paceibacterota bacterium]
MGKTKKHTLYLIGGPSRVGKSIIASEILRRRHLIAISTDGIRAAVRNVLVGESRVSVDRISFSVQAAFRRPGSLKVHKVHIVKKNQQQDDLAWQGVLGLVHAYDRGNRFDVLVEGIAVTPERVHRLAKKLKNLKVKAAFVGYSNATHADAILAYAKEKKDWVHTWIKEQGRGDASVHEWVRKGIVKNAKLKRSARKFGYAYFNLSERPFNDHVRAVMRYFS